MPLNDCSVSLDTWRQAPMVSLRSLITDPSCLELCNCSLPTIPDIIELKSPDGESTGSDMWVKNALSSLTRASQSEVTSPTGWLSEEVITAAQLLKRDARVGPLEQLCRSLYTCTCSITIVSPPCKSSSYSGSHFSLPLPPSPPSLLPPSLPLPPSPPPPSLSLHLPPSLLLSLPPSPYMYR